MLTLNNETVGRSSTATMTFHQLITTYKPMSLAIDIQPSISRSRSTSRSRRASFSTVSSINRHTLTTPTTMSEPVSWLPKWLPSWLPTTGLMVVVLLLLLHPVVLHYKSQCYWLMAGSSWCQTLTTISDIYDNYIYKMAMGRIHDGFRQFVARIVA